MPNYAIIGASGLIGGHLIDELFLLDQTTITIFTRRPLAFTDKRIKEVILDFSNQVSLNTHLAGFDAVFITVGTTQKKVNGNLEAYRQVDFNIPIMVATACSISKIDRLLIVSSVGANAKSNNFYLQLKGQVEEYVTSLPISYVGIFQPSLLLGKRNEFRLGERIAQFMLPLFSFLMPSQYKPISALLVAKAMISQAETKQKGVQRFTFKKIITCSTLKSE